MSIVISSIEPQSSAEQLNIPLGSLLISVNGHAINDVLDYGFHTAATHLRLEIQDKNSAEIKVYELF
ncbi:MAG: radical SAM protein, partial [Oscillospiraceae bacterium]